MPDARRSSQTDPTPSSSDLGDSSESDQNEAEVADADLDDVLDANAGIPSPNIEPSSIQIQYTLDRFLTRFSNSRI